MAGFAVAVAVVDVLRLLLGKMKGYGDGDVTDNYSAVCR